jgi:hypothetical protein
MIPEYATIQELLQERCIIIANAANERGDTSVLPLYLIPDKKLQYKSYS